MPDSDARGLSDGPIEQFVRDGFVKVERAFSQRDADAARAILWRYGLRSG